jgi:protein SDA1
LISFLCWIQSVFFSNETHRLTNPALVRSLYQIAQGVASSKKKKQKKLKRTLKNMQRKERRAESAVDTRFAAMQLINDPQAFAELLFGKLQVGHMSYDTKMLTILVMCRVVGMHQLVMLNVYPFLQRYIQPNQLEVRLVTFSSSSSFFFFPLRER